MTVYIIMRVELHEGQDIVSVHLHRESALHKMKYNNYKPYSDNAIIWFAIEEYETED